MRWATIYAPREIRWGCWGSEGEAHRHENVMAWRPKAGYARFVLGYLAFIVRCFTFAMKRLRRGDTLLCMDLETALLGLVAARLCGARVHYDMADPFYLAKPAPLKPLWRWLERQYIRLSDLATAPHPSRFALFFESLPDHALVVENVPDIPASDVANRAHRRREASGVLTLGYFGTLEDHRGIQDLLALVQRHPAIRLEIGGRGPLAGEVREAGKACPRIRFSGSYRVEDLASLTRDVDVYCSLYYSSKKLHRYAAPNKYFEHLALGLPILMSAGTPYAEDVRREATGWVVPDGLAALEAWQEQVRTHLSTLDDCADRARHLWETRYKDWMPRQQQRFAEWTP